MTRTWVVEIDQGGINWTPIALCFSEKQALDLATAPHIVEFGKPVRVRERGVPAPTGQRFDPEALSGHTPRD